MATRVKKLGGVAGGGGAAVRVVGVVCVMAVPLFALLVLGGWASASTVWQSAARLTAVTAGKMFVICSMRLFRDASGAGKRIFLARLSHF